MSNLPYYPVLDLDEYGRMSGYERDIDLLKRRRGVGEVIANRTLVWPNPNAGSPPGNPDVAYVGAGKLAWYALELTERGSLVRVALYDMATNPGASTAFDLQLPGPTRLGANASIPWEFVNGLAYRITDAAGTVVTSSGLVHLTLGYRV